MQSRLFVPNEFPLDLDSASAESIPAQQRAGGLGYSEVSER